MTILPLRWLLLASMVGCVEQVDRPAPAGDGAPLVSGASGASGSISTGSSPGTPQQQAAGSPTNDECADAITACLDLQGLIRDYCLMCARCSDDTEPELDARCGYVPERSGGRL